MSITTCITVTVKDGEIVLPPGIDWPNGTVVRVEQVKQGANLLHSFLVMRELGITEARTSDHHFELAGFVPRLK